MKIHVLRSGSLGNCTIVENENTLIVIDMGVTLKCLRNSLKSINKRLIDIDALLVSHEHSDHTKGIRYLDPLPIYTTRGTVNLANAVDIVPYQKFSIGSLTILPISTSHDANDPIGFVIENKNGEKCVYITDTGYIPDSSIKYLYNADYYVFESNYDLRMEMESKRYYKTKERIISDFGHLDNVDSANYLADFIGPNTKQIILAHLSRDCNSQEKALETHNKIYRKRHIDISKIRLICASQYYAVSTDINQIFEDE